MDEKQGCPPGQIRVNERCIDRPGYAGDDIEPETAYNIVKGETLFNMEQVKELIEQDKLPMETLDGLLYELREIEPTNRKITAYLEQVGGNDERGLPQWEIRDIKTDTLLFEGSRDECLIHSGKENIQLA